MNAPTTTTKVVPYDPPLSLPRRALLRRGGMTLALSTPCPIHDAKAGAPCWTFQRGDGETAEAVCGRRIAKACPPRPSTRKGARR